MKSKINPTAYIVVGVILVLISAFLVYSHKNTTEKYQKDGIEVDCVTIEIKSGRKGKQTVTGAYINDKGETVTAEVTRNAKSYVGEEYKGYILPGTPNKVYCPLDESTDKVMVIAFYGAGAAGGLLLIIGIIVSIVRKRGSIY